MIEKENVLDVLADGRWHRVESPRVKPDKLSSHSTLWISEGLERFDVGSDHSNGACFMADVEVDMTDAPCRSSLVLGKISLDGQTVQVSIVDAGNQLIMRSTDAAPAPLPPADPPITERENVVYSEPPSVLYA